VSILRNLFGKKDDEPVEMGPLYNEVRAAMSDVQAYARSHGGQIHLMGVSEEGDVKIRLTGTCKGCPMSALTLKHGVEAQLKVLVPGVRKIIQLS
jgi:Fe-S cluster biogenesis protein NfuA